MNKSLLAQKINEAIQLKENILKDDAFLSLVEEIIAEVSLTFKKGNRLWLCGNGGSAADALHLAAEFSGRYYLDRKPLAAESLNVNVAALSAISNDYSFKEAYARLLEAKAKEGDTVWLFSTSGNSENILEVAKKGKTLGVSVIGFTGESGGLLKDLCDFCLKISSNDTPRIQEIHLFIGHLICEQVEKELFS